METQLLPLQLKNPTTIHFLKLQNHYHHQTPTPSKPITTISLSSNPSHKTIQKAISTLQNGARITPKSYISLLQSCIDSNSIHLGRQLHSSISSLTETNPFVETKLVSMYTKCGTLEEARQVFDKMTDRNLFTWSAMIGGFSREKKWEEVVELFIDMMREGFTPDAFLLPKILQACSNVCDLETGRLLHSVAVRCGFLDCSVDNHVGNSILAMYAKCGELGLAKKFFEKMGSRNRVSWNAIISGHCQFGENEEAMSFFERMVEADVEPGLITWNILIASYNQSGYPERAMELMKKMEDSGVLLDVVTWTSMISGLVQNNKTSEALDLFHEMLLSEVNPNGMTVASVISACADLRSLKRGKELHSYGFKIGGGNVLVGNALVDMYAKCGRLEDAQRVFDEIAEKDVFTWNSMIGGYALAGYCGKAHDLFLKMETLGVLRNVVTWNVMMSGYIQNGDEDQAMELFQRMEEEGIQRNTASWNTLISGSLQNGNADKALNIFRQMQSNCVRPNSITILGILPAFANLVSASKVKEIHASILHSGLQSEIAITNALIYSYSNAGDISVAQTLFNRLCSRDVISWNSIICGSVLHGRSDLTLDLFTQMKKQGVKPNQGTVTCVIVAYGIERMVKESINFFSTMMKEYEICPTLEHYTAMVELFGRSGRLGEASEFIESMPIEPDSAVWNALLTAAIVHGNFRIVSLAAKHLINLESNDTKIQRLLSYALDVPNLMNPKREIIGASRGCCWIEAGNKIHTFATGDEPTNELKSQLVEFKQLTEGIKISDTRLEIDEESEEICGIHSDKLAIAFGLINTFNFKSIRIIKSIKTCADCHTIAKLVSKVYQREIFLKDPKCLHHFKDGKCSCRDYW